MYNPRTLFVTIKSHCSALSRSSVILTYLTMASGAAKTFLQLESDSFVTQVERVKSCVWPNHPRANVLTRMSTKNTKRIPISCRLVATDQWLQTHVSLCVVSQGCHCRFDVDLLE